MVGRGGRLVERIRLRGMKRMIGSGRHVGGAGSLLSKMIILDLRVRLGR